MKFNVRGADRDTGEEIALTVEAPDEVGAQDIAHRKGILVSGVALATASATPVATPPMHGRAMEQGHVVGAPVVNISPPRRGNSLGIASLVLGILAFLICWIPLVNLLGVPLSGLGLLLGLIGILVALTRKGASIGFPIAGSAVCALALFIAISMTGAFVGGLKSVTDAMASDMNRRHATNQTIAATETPTGSDEASSQPRGDDIDSMGNGAMAGGGSVEWASADVPVQQGDTQVQVVSVHLGKVPLKDSFGDGHGESKDVLLMVELRITNLSGTKKLEYRTWGGSSISFGGSAVLSDNFDNEYKRVRFGYSSEVVGSVNSESVYPGKFVQDVLVFEEPVAKVEYLHLELPAERFGGEGMLRIRIPSSMIQR